MRDNITEQIDEFMKMCETAYEEGCSEDVGDAWNKSAAAFGHIIPGYYDCLNGPDSPRGDMRSLDLPLIVAKLRIYRAKLEYDASRDKNDLTKSLMAKTAGIDINAPFDQATERIVDDESFSDQEKSELFAIIIELKNLVNSLEEKSVKWEKLKPLLTWLAAKDLRTASILIPLASDVLKY